MCLLGFSNVQTALTLLFTLGVEPLVAMGRRQDCYWQGGLCNIHRRRSHHHTRADAPAKKVPASTEAHSWGCSCASARLGLLKGMSVGLCVGRWRPGCYSQWLQEGGGLVQETWGIG